LLLGGCIQVNPPGLERQSRAAISALLRDFEPRREGAMLCVLEDVPIRRFVSSADDHPPMLDIKLRSSDLDAETRAIKRVPGHPHFLPVPAGCPVSVKFEVLYHGPDEISVEYTTDCGGLCGENGIMDLRRREGIGVSWLGRQVG
jgi:hypothetical protein